MFIEIIMDGRKSRIESSPGANLAEALVAARFAEGTECNRGLCGKCAVRLLSGSVETIDDGRPSKCPEGYILACRSLLGDSDISIELKSSKDDINRKVRLPNLCKGKSHADNPVRKIHMELAAPSLQDQASDIERVLAKLDGVKTARTSVLRHLPSVLRNADFKVTAVVIGDELCAVEPGDTTGENYGFIVDIGTTTVAIYLVNLNTGEPIDAEGLANPQRSFGADVLSRISACTDDEKLDKLQALVVNGISGTIKSLLAKNGIDFKNVYSLVAVGNTAMSHLFMGVEPANLSMAPFIPCYRPRMETRGKNLGLPVNPEARVEILANISGYVGSDTLGVAMATRPWEKPGCTLAVDIGTNGEILLGKGRDLYVCSVAAGPAFEGAHIGQGMRAGKGAIEKVRIENGKISLGVIGNCPPAGICGSGLIDAIAELLRAGIITFTGRFALADAPGARSPLASRLRTGNDGVREFVLAWRGEFGNDQDIVISQKDIRELQLAKSAIAAGIAILYKEAGITAQDVDRLCLAGAFGNYLDRENAVALGIFPGIPVEKIIPVGNAAAEGAGLCLVSLAELVLSDEVAAGVKPVELSARSDFTDLWINCMNFPTP